VILKSYLEHDSTALVSTPATAGCSRAVKMACAVQDDTIRVPTVRSSGEGMHHALASVC